MDGGDTKQAPLRVALVVVLVLVGFALVPRLFQGQKPPMVGKEAPGFRGRAIANVTSGSSLSLTELRGKPVLLDFWATWCGPCNAEAPVLDQLARRFQDRGLVVLGVNTGDDEEVAKAWAKARNLSFPLVFDDGPIASHYGVKSLPTLIMISKEGTILAIREGMTSPGELEKLVAQAL